MALLTHPTDRRRGRVLFALVLGAAGCVLFGGGRAGKPFAFSHKVHVDGEGLDCADCHAASETTGRPAMPALAACNLCHTQIDADKPPERRVAALYDGTASRQTKASALDGEIVFAHDKHVAAVQDCNACHQGIAQNEVVDASVAVEKAACLACHSSKNVADDCATCHREQRSDRAPRTHQNNWLRFHGKTVRAESEAIVDRCSMCHTESTCVTCHQTQLPDSHNNFFRRRGHGLVARMDRENCAACHRADSCDSCHEQTRPQSHVGSFGGRRNTHCFACHLPVEASDCVTCHRATPSHLRAAPLPSGHTPSMNCRACHGVSAPLPHVDKGDHCTACHR